MTSRADDKVFDEKNIWTGKVDTYWQIELASKLNQLHKSDLFKFVGNFQLWLNWALFQNKNESEIYILFRISEFLNAKDKRNWKDFNSLINKQTLLLVIFKLQGFLVMDKK